MVIAILLCRSTAIATRGCTSSATSRLAQVRRVACTGMIGTPALAARVLKAVWKLRGSSGSPTRVVQVQVQVQVQVKVKVKVQVELDGQRVGVLSPTQTKNLNADRGVPRRSRVRRMARAVVVGSSLHAEVVFTVKAANDIDDWLRNALQSEAR